jgi:hypothetical protein
MNLVFYPDNIKLNDFKDYFNEIINDIKNSKEDYKIYKFNDITVNEVNEFNCISNNSNLLVALEFLNKYMLDLMTNYKVQITTVHIFTNEDINKYSNINISDYISMFIKEIRFYDLNNVILNNTKWLENKRFKYIKEINLIYYPSDFNLEYIKNDVQHKINELVNNNQHYKLFDYNNKTVMEQNNLDFCRSYGRNLNIVFEHMKNYVENSKFNYNIYVFSDGLSDSYQYIDINKYISNNINIVEYIVNKKQYIGKNDFNTDWLNNKKFKYINL